ncbi:helix-turn-helix transcriptional regulator [Nocardioides anomalus]|uniref:helix-turn-helix transcriptional regulator n=1 Tax=Nocardioides anomalus TaxID=2712223 RepID=UPI001E5632A1|nr:helix-turn-helix domain-containing protein [Nocardioides anomalus]
MVTDVRTAAAILGISRSHAYDLINRGEFPFPVLAYGHRKKVPVAGILLHLGFAGDDDDDTTTRTEGL